MDKSVFDFSDENWNEIGAAILLTGSNKENIQITDSKLKNLDSNVYSYCDSSIKCKDGFVIYNKNDFTIVGIRILEEKKDNDGNTYYEHKFKFFSNKLVFPIYALNDLMRFTHEGCYHGLEYRGKGLFLDCLVSGEEAERNDRKTKLEEISENLYHLTYNNDREDLEDASCNFQRTLELSNYFESKYDRLRNNLERLAITQHRNMMANGKIKDEYVLPIEKVKGLSTQADNER